MLSEEQFESMIDRLESKRAENLSTVLQGVLTALLPAREDRDRLIKIEAKQEALVTLLSSMRMEDLKKIDAADAAALAAHKRIDTQAKWVIGTMLVTVGGMILTALFVYMKG